MRAGADVFLSQKGAQDPGEGSLGWTQSPKSRKVASLCRCRGAQSGGLSSPAGRSRAILGDVYGHGVVPQGAPT